MCDHKRDDGKKQGFVSGLCKICSADERWDRQQIKNLYVKSPRKIFKTKKLK